MKRMTLALLLWVICGQLTALEGNKPPSVRIIDMMLASTDDDPEPYLIDYIQDKEKLRVKKIRVLGAPDRPDLYYTAYQTVSNRQCRNLWLVRISLSEEAAQGLASVIPCEQAKREGLLQRANRGISFSPAYWPQNTR